MGGAGVGRNFAEVRAAKQSLAHRVQRFPGQISADARSSGQSWFRAGAEHADDAFVDRA